jgi:predicted RNA-binding protein YlqC (UPF0109 family)
VSIDQQFVEFVIKSLVTKPEAVKIERRIDEKGVLLELTVDPEDLGRVIGKRGATAQSVRTLLRALGTKNDARYNLKIVDNGIGSDSATASKNSASNGGTWGDGDNATGSNDESTAKTDAPVSNDDDDEIVEDKKEESDVVAKTRRELHDLDDLDV